MTRRRRNPQQLSQEERQSRLVRLHFAPEYAVCLLSVALVMLVVASFTGNWVTNENPYRSYTLQACAWLEGRLDLGRDYPWLELAIVDGKYYVSFPPFPSFVLLPFAAVFGTNTPDHLISLAFTLLGVVYALKLYERVTGSLRHAERWVLFLFLGNGYLFISMQGWVWYLAQCMCFTLSLMAIYYAAKGRGGWSLAFWACAVGCRPMVIVYFPLLAVLLWRSWRAGPGERTLKALLVKRAYWAVPVVLIASVYMALNAARFGNPFEFGHSYLPEFVRAPEGQFSLSYAAEHFAQLLHLPEWEGTGNAMTYDAYDCMAFWLIAPVSISFLAAWGYALTYKRRTHGLELVALPVMLFVHVMIICCHRTLGGFQFGNRYLVDLLPFVFYGLLALGPRGERWALVNVPLFMLGFSVNLIGTVAAYNHWI